MQYDLAILVLALNIVFFLRAFRMGQPAKASGLWSVAQTMGLLAVCAVYHLSLKYQFASGGFGVEYLASGCWAGSLEELLRLFIFNTRDIVDFVFPMAHLGVLLVIFGLVGAAGGRGPMRATSIMLLMVPLVTTFFFAIARFYPYIGARQTIFLSPMIYVFLAAGVFFLVNVKYVKYLVIPLLVALLFCGGSGSKRFY